jgi:hypothetical protein
LQEYCGSGTLAKQAYTMWCLLLALIVFQLKPD